MLTDLTLTDHEFLPPLRIERLARLNLLVGNNGVGKTTVLEAIHGRPGLLSLWFDCRRPLPDAFRGRLVVLLDEVGHSVHHTKMLGLWRYWCNIALECDLQIFASTHSWDCIKGFAAALEENPKVDGMVIRLERKPEWDRMGAVWIGQEDLRIVIRDRIEIR